MLMQLQFPDINLISKFLLLTRFPQKYGGKQLCPFMLRNGHYSTLSLQDFFVNIYFKLLIVMSII